MPTIPTYDNFQVQPNTVQGQFNIPEVKNYAAQQAVEQGQAMMQLGADFGRLSAEQKREEEEANNFRVAMAIDSLKNEQLRLTFDKDVGFTNLKGPQAAERPDGKPLTDEYSEQLQKKIEDLSSGLSNDDQRMKFYQVAMGTMTSFRGNLLKHESGEYVNWKLSVADSRIDTETRSIGLNYNNIDETNKSINVIKNMIHQQAKLKGYGGEWQEAAVRKATSNAHMTALGAAIEKNDISFADGYLKKYKGDMDADDILKASGIITKVMDTQIAGAAAYDAMRGANFSPSTPDSNRVFNLMLQAESGGSQFDKTGKVMTSKVGAIGIAQVMPATAPEAAKLAGLPWDENRYRNDPEYNKAIGQAYFNERLRKWGNPALAVAAYHSGDGNVQKAVDNEKRLLLLAKTDPNVQPRSWLSFLGPDGQKYVKKVMGGFSEGKGATPVATFQDIDNKIRSDPRIAESPQRYKEARDQAEKIYKDSLEAKKQQDGANVLQAQEWLVRNNGDYSKMPVAIRSNIPADKMDDVMKFGAAMAKGPEVSTDWRLYTELRQLAGNNPKEFSQMPLTGFYDRLAPSEREKIIDLQDQTKKPGGANEVATKAQQSVKYHRMMGFNAGDDKKKGDFDNAVDAEISAFNTTHGRMPNYDERDKIFKRMMLNVSSTFGSKSFYQVYGTAGAKDAQFKMSDDDREIIVNTLEEEGVPVTQENIIKRFRLRYGI